MTRSLEAATTRPDRQEREAGVDLHGRVALVTGGGRGVGRLLARTLAEAGAAVALIARSSDELATTVEQIRDAGAVAAAASADVTDEIAVTAALAQLRAQLGPVDILVNNAGINGPMGVMWETESADWWRTLEVNLGGAFVLSRMLLPDMIAAGRGRIINITSNAGVYRWPLVSAYVTSKAALIKLTETLAAETVKHGVSVFSVDPGLLPIGLSDAALMSTAQPDTPEGRVFGWIRGQLKAGRGADPGRAAQLILELASGRGDCLSGRHLTVADDLDTLLGRSDEIRRGDLHTLRLCTGAPITGPPLRDPPGARERAPIKAVERDTTFTRRRGLAANTPCTSAIDAAAGQLGFAGRSAGDLILARSEEIPVAPGPDEIDVTDRARLAQAVDFIEGNDTGTVISQLVPGLSGDQADAVAARCGLSHAAVLVFPRSLSGLHDHLPTIGLTVGKISHSVVVRDRLCRRYGLPRDSINVRILRAPVSARNGESCMIEIFALPVGGPGELGQLAARERASGQEAHVALEVHDPDTVVLSGLRSLLIEAGLRSDGGGYSEHEDATVLYFRADDRPEGIRRLELIAAGRHSAVLAAHLGEPEADPATRLLQLMTGAWRTQAIAVAAELRLADHIAGQPEATVEQLASATATDPDSLGRLVRYLAGLGIVKRSHTSVRLTELGELLRTDASPSLHALALLYGGPFYESFGELAHSVRTGRAAFDHVFGKHHFEYFAERPQLAGLFDRAMASSASIFGRIADIVDLSAASVVVDVAGGNGELLAQILSAAPQVRGVLLERSHALKAARSKLHAVGCADRCQLITGDFTTAVPSDGDVYILSRVLHDWDDEQCRLILKRCAEAMSPKAQLLILERLLPQDDSPSLAAAWDVHMLCNVGGRERTAGHYRRLLRESGFRLTGQHRLPLEFVVLQATPRPA
jgi:NAD(P)-dependent dehydrogenase (short-subunit alcohol dehydrogenase family)/ubiquinone/menaquinone biosynthesis C-methylase UbiE